MIDKLADVPPVLKEVRRFGHAVQLRMVDILRTSHTAKPLTGQLEQLMAGWKAYEAVRLSSETRPSTWSAHSLNAEGSDPGYSMVGEKQ